MEDQGCKNCFRNFNLSQSKFASKLNFFLIENGSANLLLTFTIIQTELKAIFY